MTVDPLLSRLDHVKAKGVAHWTARCPAHKDHSPSLAIRELADGRVLVHCFSGCATSDILAAVGLEFSDLYPEPLPTLDPDAKRTAREGFSGRVVLEALAFEATVVAAAAGTLARKGWLTEDEEARLATAQARILAALSYLEHRG